MRQHSKSTVFNLLILCLGILLSADYFQPAVLASPITDLDSLEPRDLVKRYSGTPKGKDKAKEGPDTSDWPSDQEIQSAFIQPSGPFVFFSGLDSSQEGYDFAKSLNNGAVILRGAFPKSFTVQKGKEGRSAAWQQDFFDRASGIFADEAVKAGNTVYFVGRYDATVKACSIWSRIELPTLIAGGISITLVDYSNFDRKKPYPVPDALAPAPIISSREANVGLVKRQDYCFDWQGDREDPADPDSDPQIGLDYYPGNCGVHLRQYQKNEGKAASNGNGGTSNYRFTIQLQDDQHEQIGGVEYYDAPAGQGVDVNNLEEQRKPVQCGSLRQRV
ncbi:MAG: hypothetical protein Q9228_005103 [Teloschistes exilis]